MSRWKFQLHGGWSGSGRGLHFLTTHPVLWDWTPQNGTTKLIYHDEKEIEVVGSVFGGSAHD